jgi:hypothetical protein
MTPFSIDKDGNVVEVFSEYSMERAIQNDALSIGVMADVQWLDTLLTIFSSVDRGSNMSCHGRAACPRQESDRRERYKLPAFSRG